MSMSSSGPATVQVPPIVHAQLPTVKPSDPRYSDPSTSASVPCLEFPVDRANQLQFSLKPLRWVRYCLGAVTGARGHLSRKPDWLDTLDYDQPLALGASEDGIYLPPYLWWMEPSS